MQTIKFKIFKILFLALLFTGCSDDFLDLKPLDQEVTATFYQTEDQAMQGLVAVMIRLVRLGHHL